MRKAMLYCLLLFCADAYAQQRTDTLDLNEAVRKIFGSKDAEHAGSGISILPAVGYNPSIGFMLGGTLTGGKTLGNPATTRLSTGTFTGYLTTKGIINIQLRHNVFTNNNTWNFQGNGQITKMVLLDYGLGPTAGSNAREAMSVNQYTLENSDSVFPIKFNYVRLFEKVYKKISRTLMVGAGLGIDYHFSIKDTKLNLDSGNLTPHYTYSVSNGFKPTSYWTNGFLLNIQYNTKEHPNRPQGGMYADIAFRFNPRFLGSSESSALLMTEFRKYISLSTTNPEHVLAFWHLATYNLGGTLPYLDLPGTGTDMYNRSGRAYTIGRFRGLSYFYIESEYRFPITANKFLSGVAFLNMQTMSDGKSRKLFQGWDPGAGMGLRILFNRNTRTNICIDYAFGLYGAKGYSLG